MAIRIESQAEPIPGYKLLVRLGGGGFGEVWKAEAPGGLLKAVKIVHGDLRTLDDDGQHRADQELKAIQRVQSVRHPYLLSLERYDIVDGRLVIVTELADCNLMDRFRQCRDAGLPGIPREDLLRYMAEASEVLDLMNGQYQLQHLDIKPQNIFLIHDHIKVADFGLVKDLDGVRATMTGGVTPVYASPETFEGLVSRFSDQYSLAICYQELLTGQRPFAGTTIHQLVTQHLQSPPNLSPLPASDRPAVARALSKKPEDRFPTCTAFVRALRPSVMQSVVATMASVTSTQPTNVDQSRQPLGRYAVAPPMRNETPPSQLRIRREDARVSPIMEGPAVRTAPPEFTGNGALVPTVVVAAGGAALLALLRWRLILTERFGDAVALPHLRAVFIDTDPQALDEAARVLETGQVVRAPIQRASHYLKPRKAGISLIDGWFDSGMLYRIPRTGVTQGLRALGRLALVDHAAAFQSALDAQLEMALHPDALLNADKHTCLGVRSNRPRVIVLAGLGGGTGSGMAFDLAYIARARLQQLGYPEPDVRGLLLVPAVDRTSPGRATATGNACAALMELRHFGRAHTEYRAQFDGRDGQLVDAAPPFGRCHILRLRGRDGDGPDGAAIAADFLARDLASPVGRALDEQRDALTLPARESPTVSLLGAATLAWPRRALLGESARRLGAALLERWASKDAEGMQSVVQAWVATEWATQNLGPEHLITRFGDACERVLGKLPEQVFGALAEPFTPRGWLAGLNAQAASDYADRVDELLGRPDDATGRGVLLDALNTVAETLAREWGDRMVGMVSSLVERPELRLAGAEEAVAQLRDALDRVLAHYAPLAQELVQKALATYYKLHAIWRGETPRRTAAADFSEAAKQYPKTRYQSLVLRQLLAVCNALRGRLAEELQQLNFCRQRLEELLLALRRDAAPDDDGAGDSYLLPAGCRTLGEAVRRVLEEVTASELAELDDRVQRAVVTQYGGLARVCLTSPSLAEALGPLVKQHATQYLGDRLGDASVAELFFASYPDHMAGAHALANRYTDAAPALTDATGPEACVLALPPGPLGDRLAQLARMTLAPARLAIAASADDIAFVRETPGVAIDDLPHLGREAREALRQLLKLDHFTPHTRTDVEKWE